MKKAFVETDIEFHYALVQATGNKIYLALHDAFMQWLADQRLISAIGGADAKRVYLEHLRIFETVAAGDAAAAQDAMQSHLDGVVQLYWSVKDRGATQSPRLKRTVR